MKVNSFISKLKLICDSPTTYYSVSGGAWASWNGYSWNFDCVILIKAILWGWNGNKNHAHGGANYLSNGVYDDNANTILDRCYNISTNFNNIEPGELVWLPGHVGIYIGNGEVIEATAGWESKVLKSKIGKNGERTRNGVQIYAWKKHGKLKYIDYTETSKPINNTSNLKYKIGDVVNFDKVYVSSTSTKALKPLYTSGKIVRIVNNSNNPYLIQNIGWINDSCICEKVNKDTIYIVKKGDTLWKIASKYNTTSQKIYDDNKDVIGINPDIIEIGMKLKIK